MTLYVASCTFAACEWRYAALRFRILRKEGKMEVWLCNPSEKDVAVKAGAVLALFGMVTWARSRAATQKDCPLPPCNGALGWL